MPLTKDGLVEITPIKGANLALAFLLELGVLAGLAYWGWTLGGNFAEKFALGGALAVIALVVWAQFGAPRSVRRLKGNAYWVLRGAFDLAGALALFAAGLTVTAIAFAVVAAINVALGYAWDQGGH